MTKAELVALLEPSRRGELRALAHETTLRYAPRRFEFCSILSARSGRCCEDCKWCAQSAHWHTSCETSDWVGTSACVAAARAAAAAGADRFGLVTSGRNLSAADLASAVEAITQIKRACPGLSVCGSFGLIALEDIVALKAAGLDRIHCNIETAPSLFPSLCTTHMLCEKISTLRAARSLGLEICCGGIIGMGETNAQLVEFALALAALAPDSIPVNILHPIPGTPLGTRERLSPDRIVDSIAILRLANPSTPLRFAGGRRDLPDDVAADCIHVGITAGIAGNLLTTPGADFATDRALAIKAGFSTSNPNHNQK